MQRLQTHTLRHILPATAAALMLLCVLTAPALAFDRAGAQTTMLRLINHARTSRGLHALRAHDALQEAALSHSSDMLRCGYFAHSSLSGTGVDGRARRAGYSVGGWARWTVGEVIAWGASVHGSPQAVFKAWMHSSCHRSIILGRRWRDVGVGCVSGRFRGMSGVALYTVDVGRRVQ